MTVLKSILYTQKNPHQNKLTTDKIVIIKYTLGIHRKKK